jgi:WD40 repeat protein
MAAGAGSGQLRLWAVDCDSGRDLGGGTYANDFATFSPDGVCVIGHGGNFTHQFRRWMVPEGEELPRGWGGEVPGPVLFPGPLTFSPDGQLLVHQHWQGAGSMIVLRDGSTGEELKRFWHGGTSRATRLAFSPESKLLASIHGPTLVLWDMTSRTEFGRGRVANKRFTGLAFTADSSRLLTASNDTFLRVWTAPTWEQTTTYKWDAGKLGCVAVSADGTLAAAGASTGKVVVWDLD